MVSFRPGLLRRRLSIEMRGKAACLAWLTRSHSNLRPSLRHDPNDRPSFFNQRPKWNLDGMRQPTVVDYSVTGRTQAALEAR